MTRKCVALFSGGLDSTLALRAVTLQGVEAVAFHCSHLFAPRTDSPEGREELRRVCLGLGAAETVFKDTSGDMIWMVKQPCYGFGKRLNPCLDCRLNVVRHAKALMDEIGADFLVSGEVLGQRPMSQRKDAMRQIDKILRGLGLEGLLLRPLSAGLLEPTIPEKEGWVDRTKFYDIYGRGRGRQMQIAAEFGISDYQTPAGGCLLTEPCFVERLSDLIAHDERWGLTDGRLLRVGRHFRISDRCKVVISRKDYENALLEEYAAPGESLYIASPRPGAEALVRGEWSEEAERVAAGLAAFYSKQRGEAAVAIRRRRWGEDGEVYRDCGAFPPLAPESMKSIYIGPWQG